MKYKVYVGPDYNIEGLLCSDFLKWQGNSVEINIELGPFLVNSRGHARPTIFKLKDDMETLIAEGFEHLYEYHQKNGMMQC